MMNAIDERAVPDPATTPWVPVGPSAAGAPGKDGAGVPQPVVNGQWVKGVGGAAVWSPIADADVPSVNTGGRLGDVGKNIADCNQAIGNGWYFGNAGAANAPTSDYFSLFVVQLNGPGNLTQIAYAYQTDAVWKRRYKDATNWSPWVPRNNGPVVAARVRSDGVLISGTPGVSSSKWSGLPDGYYLVQWTTQIISQIVLVTATDALVPAQVTPWSNTQVQVAMGINTQYNLLTGFMIAIFEGQGSF